MVVGLRRPLEGDAEERTEARRELRRKQRVAFDDAGIAVGGALSGIAAVDEGDGKAALGEMQRHRNADDTGAEHDRIGASHENSRKEGLEGWLRGSTRNSQHIGATRAEAILNLRFRVCPACLPTICPPRRPVLGGHQTGGPDASPARHRSIDPVRRLRQARRGGARDRRGRRRLDPCRRHGRPFRAQHHHRPRRGEGAAAAYAKSRSTSIS